MITRATAAASATTVSAAVFAAAVRLADARAVHASILTTAGATATAATIISAQLPITIREDIRIGGCAIECVAVAIVIVVVIKAIRKPRSIRVGEVLINYSVTIVIELVAELWIFIVRIVAGEYTVDACLFPFDA